MVWFYSLKLWFFVPEFNVYLELQNIYGYLILIFNRYKTKRQSKVFLLY